LFRSRSCSGPPARMMLSIRFLTRVLLLLLLLLGGQVLAQEPVADDAASTKATGLQVNAEQRTEIAAIAKRTDLLKAQLELNATDDAVLVEIRTQLEEINRKLLASGVSFRPRLETLNARLDEIGDPAEDEPASLADERQNLTAEKTDINTLLGEAEALSLRVNGMIEEIARTRRDLFANTLSRRYDISAAVNQDVW